MTVFVWLVIIGTAIWVYFDAKSIGVKKGQITGILNMGPVGWFFVTLLLWIIGFPAYLATRGKYKKINQGSSINSTESNVKACPYCAELIKKEAIFCLHCKKDIVAKE